MLDTIKKDVSFSGMVGHRGCGGLQTENTLRAFNEGGRRSYVGLECDVHSTKDKIIVVSHDSSLLRVGGIDMKIPEHTFEELRAVRFPDLNTGKIEDDLFVPLLTEYLHVCKKYDKRPVIELKETLAEDDIEEVIKEVKESGLIDKVIFISFFPGYLTKVRRMLPEVEIEFLSQIYTPGILDFCSQFKFGIDAYYKVMTKEIIDGFHKAGLKVNVYTVDNKEDVERLASYGIDYITSNIVE